VSQVYHKFDALMEKADTLMLNQTQHMRMSSTSTGVTTQLPEQAIAPSVVTPSPPAKKPRLLTVFFSPVSSPSLNSNVINQVNLLYTMCIYFLYKVYTHLFYLYTKCIQIYFMCIHFVYRNVFYLYNLYINYTNCIDCHSC
jgi:hypothetical protein